MGCKMKPCKGSAVHNKVKHLEDKLFNVTLICKTNFKIFTVHVWMYMYLLYINRAHATDTYSRNDHTVYALKALKKKNFSYYNKYSIMIISV